MEKRKLRGRNILAISLYIVLLAFRFVSLLMYTIFSADCLLYRSSTGADCQNFTIYPHPYQWKLAWASLSITNLLLLFLVLSPSVSRNNRDLAPLGLHSALKVLKGRPQFWTSIAQIICASIYDVMITVKNSGTSFTLWLFIVMKVLTLLMIYQLNFIFPPTTAKGYSFPVVVAYNLTLLCFTMDYLLKFFMESTGVVFKVYTFKVTGEQHSEKVINLMLMIINASLYRFMWNFLWNKLFCGDKDILTTFRSNFEDTVGIG